MILREIAAFLAYSLIWLPLTGLFIWALYLILRYTKLPRVLVVLISCVIVAVSLHFIESVRTFDTNDVYELIDVGIWLVVGIFLCRNGNRVSRTKAD